MTQQEAEIWLAMLLAQYGKSSIFDILTKYTPDIFKPSNHHTMSVPLSSLPIGICMSHGDLYALKYGYGTLNFIIHGVAFTEGGVRVQQEWDNTTTYKLISYQEFFNLKDETV